ncbi:hypothetical protein COCC4DRAFT_151420, partial [Bipolaris maydis ATCC 48331]
SPNVKPSTGGLVVRWVTTGESPLLYVFVFASPLIFTRSVSQTLAGSWYQDICSN